MSNSSDEQDPVDVLARDFLARCRMGTYPAISSYVSRIPERADEIRDALEAILLLEGLPPQVFPSRDTATYPSIPDFRIVREIGRGGMGTVFEAEQLSLSRRVALKLLHATAAGDEKRQKRFLREATAAAGLHHTNIVPVFSVGVVSGHMYYAMQYIDGMPLDKLLRHASPPQCHNDSAAHTVDTVPSHSTALVALRNRWLPPCRTSFPSEKGAHHPPRLLASSGYADTQNIKHSPCSFDDNTCLSATPDMGTAGSINPPLRLDASPVMDHDLANTYWHRVATLGSQIASALEYAHSQGVLHRDVKPANIVVDQRDSAWLADFGLAHVDDGHNITTQGDLLGTVRYMAPEVFRGLTCKQSDVYSLGLTLYELLASRPAFVATDKYELIAEVMRAQPVSLQHISTAIPVDLCIIVHRAIEPDLDLRFASANELSAELQRYLNDLPILSRQYSRLERLFRWGRRNRDLALSLLALLTFFILVSAGAGLSAQYFRDLSQTLSETVLRLQTTTADLEASRDKLRAAGREALEARHNAESALADMQVERGLQYGRDGDAATAALWFANAALVSPTDRQRSDANRLRSRNWLRTAPNPTTVITLPAGSVQDASLQPGGSLLASLTGTHFRLWESRSGSALEWTQSLDLVSGFSWSPSGTRIAIRTTDGCFHIRDSVTGNALSEPRLGVSVTALRWSPDGNRIVAIGTDLRLWNCQDRPYLEQAWNLGSQAYAASFSPSGDLIAVSTIDDQVHVFSTLPATTNGRPVYSCEHAPNHRDNRRGTACFWHGGSRLATISKQGLPAFRDSRTGEVIPVDWPSEPLALNFGLIASPDGRNLAAIGTDSVVVWCMDHPSAKLPHRNHIIDASFRHDGRSLATTCFDGFTYVWGGKMWSPEATLPQMGTMALVDYGRFSNQCAIAAEGHIVLWGLPPQSPSIGSLTGWNSASIQPRISLDGTLVTPGAWHENPWGVMRMGTSLSVYSTGDGKPVGPDIRLSGSLIDSCVCSDNRTVVSGQETAEGGLLSFHDSFSGAEVLPPLKLAAPARSVVPHPTQPFVAVLCRNGQIQEFDVTSGKLLWATELPAWSDDAPHSRILFSPDASALVALSPANTLFVLDPTTGKLKYAPLPPLQGHLRCRTATISRDARWLAAAYNGENTVEFWDLATGRRAGRQLHHTGDYYGLQSIDFSPDGLLLATGHKDGMLRIFNWQTGTLAVPEMYHSDEVYSVKCSDDGRFVVVAVRNGPVHVWELATAKLACPPLSLADDGSATTSGPLAITESRLIASATLGRVFNLTEIKSPPLASPSQLAVESALASNSTIRLGTLSPLGPPKAWSDLWSTHRRTVASQPDAVQLRLEELDAASGWPNELMIAEHALQDHVLDSLLPARPESPALHAVAYRHRLRIGDARGAASHLEKATKLLELCLADGRHDPPRSFALAQLLASRREPDTWTPAELLQVSSPNKCTFESLADNSILATPDFSNLTNDYVLNCHARPGVLSGIRITALPDERLPNGGPGWDSGNFGLTGIVATVLRRDGTVHDVLFSSACSDYVRPLDRDTTPADGPWAVLDADDTTRWDIWPQTGVSHWLQLRLATPLTLESTDEVTLTLQFRHPHSAPYRLGRFKIDFGNPHGTHTHSLIATALQQRVFSDSEALAAAYLLANDPSSALRTLQQHVTPTSSVTTNAHRWIAAVAADELADSSRLKHSIDSLLHGIRHDPIPRFLQSEIYTLLSKHTEVTPDTFRELVAECTTNRELRQLALALSNAPESPSALLERAELLARTGRWREGAADCLNAHALSPADRLLWLRTTAYLLLGNDVDGHSTFANALHTQFNTTRNPLEADVLCKACLLRNTGIPLSSLPLGLVEKGASAPEYNAVREWLSGTLALAALRNGEYEQAIAHAAVPRLAPPLTRALPLLVTAMAEWHLGRHDSARMMLLEAESLIPASLRDSPGSAPHPISVADVYHDWLIAELLRREARVTITGFTTPE